MDWPALLSGAGSLFGSIGNAIFGQSQSKDLMRYQYQLNQKAIDAQNVYNSPIEQVKRLRQAGLNENLAFGNGVTGNQSDAKSVGIANRNPNLDSGLMAATEAYFKHQQIDNDTSRAHQEVKESQSRESLNRVKTLGQVLDNKYASGTLKGRIAKVFADLAYTEQAKAESEQRVNESVQRTSNLQSQANLLQEQIKYWEAHAQNEKNFMPDLLRARAFQAWQSGNLSVEQQEVARSIVRLNDKKIEHLISAIKKLDIEAGLEGLEFQIQQSMKNFGAAGIKPKDVLDFLLKMLQTALK